MRRWNGWGDEAIDYPLPESAREYLAGKVGSGFTEPDASLEQLLRCVPPSRLPGDSRWSLEPRDRLLHACGQSLPDWVGLKTLVEAKGQEQGVHLLRPGQ